MARFGSRDTKPELALRKRLHASGLRYRVHLPVPGLPRRTIDVAFPKRRIAVFVDGCYWHGCPDHGKQPSVNSEWWAWKIGRNVARDRETDASLQREGWRVIRIWEHESPEEALSRVLTEVRKAAG